MGAFEMKIKTTELTGTALDWAYEIADAMLKEREL